MPKVHSSTNRNFSSSRWRFFLSRPGLNVKGTSVSHSLALLSKELQYLIVWPSKEEVFATLPEAFKKIYTKVFLRTDCTEVCFERSSSLQWQANPWSDYKHISTNKYTVATTPNGVISWNDRYVVVMQVVYIL